MLERSGYGAVYGVTPTKQANKPITNPDFASLGLTKALLLMRTHPHNQKLCYKADYGDAYASKAELLLAP